MLVFHFFLLVSTYLTKALGLLRIVPASTSMQTVQIRDSTILKLPVSSWNDATEEKHSSPPHVAGQDVIGHATSKGKKKAIKNWGGAEGIFNDYPDTK